MSADIVLRHSLAVAYIKPRLYCAPASPWSAALRSQRGPARSPAARLGPIVSMT